MNCVYLLAVLGTFVFLQADLTHAAEIADGVKKPDEQAEKGANFDVDVKNMLESGCNKENIELVDTFKKLQPGVTVDITTKEKDGLDRMLEVALGCGNATGKARHRRAAESCSASCGDSSCSCEGGNCCCDASIPHCGTCSGGGGPGGDTALRKPISQ